MDICEMCAHRTPGKSEDDFNCNKKCHEYIEFAALPVYDAAPDMYEALKELEWSGIYEWDEYDANHCCPVCEALIHDPHKPDCLLWQALSKAEGGSNL